MKAAARPFLYGTPLNAALRLVKHLLSLSECLESRDWRARPKQSTRVSCYPVLHLGTLKTLPLLITQL